VRAGDWGPPLRIICHIAIRWPAFTYLCSCVCDAIGYMYICLLYKV
jgi:hypothetical protein